MKIKSISYSKTFNLGNYSNEKIGVEIELSENESAAEAHAQAVKHIQRAHSFQKQYPDYEQAKKVVSDSLNYTGNEINASYNTISKFESEFKEFLDSYKLQEIDAPLLSLNDANDDISF